MKKIFLCTLAAMAAGGMIWAACDPGGGAPAPAAPAPVEAEAGGGGNPVSGPDVSAILYRPDSEAMAAVEAARERRRARRRNRPPDPVIEAIKALDIPLTEKMQRVNEVYEKRIEKMMRERGRPDEDIETALAKFREDTEQALAEVKAIVGSH